MTWGDEEGEEQGRDLAESSHWSSGNPANFCVYSGAQLRPWAERALGSF